MSKRKSVTEIEIPRDVLEEILVMLPVKSLLRFICVEKSWCALVQNPTFASKQLIHRHSCTSDFDHALLVIGNKFSLLESPDISLGNLNNIENPWIVGQCDGLICFSTFNSEKRPVFAIHLWNPTLGQHKILPQSDILPSKRRYARVEEDKLGFGYDPKSKDYKVVQFAYYCRDYDDTYYDVKAQAYSLRNNSWRPVVRTLVVSGLKCTAPYRYVTCGACLGGLCYWCRYTYTFGHHKWIIISYDMSNEVLRQIYVPDQVHYYRPLNDNHLFLWRLFVWKESITLVMFPCGNSGTGVRFIDIWSFEDEVEGNDLDLNRTLKVKELRSLPVVDDGLKEVHLLWNDEMIVNSYNKGLQACNITTQKLTKICLPRYGQIFQAVGYTRSLVSLFHIIV